jgi:hypothetical protein
MKTKRTTITATEMNLAVGDRVKGYGQNAQEQADCATPYGTVREIAENTVRVQWDCQPSAAEVHPDSIKRC